MPCSKQEQPEVSAISQRQRSMSSHPRAKSQKGRMTVQVDGDILERAKNAVYWTAGLTLAHLTEAALKEAIERLEKRRKEPFPQRRAALKVGRPAK